MAIPSRQQAFELLWAHNVPQNIIRHSIAVSRVAMEVAEKLKSKGKKVDLELLDRACILHDIGKMEGIATGGPHELIGSEIVKKHEFRELSEIIRKHPLHYILDKKNAPKTIEEKILFYADKRVMHHKIVLLKQRLADLEKRYPEYAGSIRKAGPLVLKLEKELLE